MRAIQVRRYGGSEELVEWELGTPEPGPGEVLVRITHAGEAHRVMEQGGTRGKLLLCMTDGK